MKTIETTSGISVYRVKSDICGNPRYVVSWLSLNLPRYEATKKTRAAGLCKYRGKDFGGGFVFQSYNVDKDIKHILSLL